MLACGIVAATGLASLGVWAQTPDPLPTPSTPAPPPGTPAQTSEISASISKVTLNEPATLRIVMIVKNETKSALGLAGITGEGIEAVSGNGNAYYLNDVNGIEACQRVRSGSEINACAARVPPEDYTRIDAGQPTQIILSFQNRTGGTPPARESISFPLRLLVRAAEDDLSLSGPQHAPKGAHVVTINFPLVPLNDAQ